MSALSFHPIETLTLEAFLTKYLKLRPGFTDFQVTGSFVEILDSEDSGAEESKSEESVGDLSLLGMMQTLYRHLSGRWPDSDGFIYVSSAEMACMREFAAIQDLHAYVHSIEEFLEIRAYFEQINFLHLSTDALKFTLKKKLESLADSLEISQGEDFVNILCCLSRGRDVKFFQKHPHVYQEADVLIQLKIAARLALSNQELSLRLMPRINFNRPMSGLKTEDIEFVLNNLSVRSRFAKKGHALKFRLHEIGYSGEDENYFYPPKELSFFALRLPVVGSLGAQAVAEFATHKKIVCEGIKSIPELSLRIQILHALLYEKGSIGYEGIRVKRGMGPFSKPCSFFSGELGGVLSAYEKSIKTMVEIGAVSVLRKILKRFEDSGMSPIPDALIQKLREPAAAAVSAPE